jgi:hypothetical protein
VLNLDFIGKIMGGCFGNHWIDRQLEDSLFNYLDSLEEEEE